VVAGVVGVLDDEQPAAAATQISAAAVICAAALTPARPVAERTGAACPIQESTVPEYLALDHIGVPSMRAAPHAPFSDYDANAGTVVAAASTPGGLGPVSRGI
jgi:hypothetical protein